MATLAGELAEHEQALALWRLAAQNAASGQPRARARLGGARAAHALGRSQEARTLLDRARAESPGRLLSIEIDALDAAVSSWLEHRLPEGQALAARSLTRARVLLESRSLGEAKRAALLVALQAGIEAALMRGDPAEMLTLADQAIELAGASTRLGLTMLVRSALALELLGRLNEAVGRTRQAWLGAHQQLFPDLIIEAGQQLTALLVTRLELKEAETVGQEAFELYQRLGGELERLRGPNIGLIAGSRLLTRLVSGDWTQVVGDFETEIGAIRDPHFRLTYRRLLFGWLTRLAPQARRAQALAHLDAALIDVQLAGCPRSGLANLRNGKPRVPRFPW